MSRVRLALLLALGAGLLFGRILAPAAAPPARGDKEFPDPIRLPDDAAGAKRLDTAADAIKGGSWPEAIPLLQAVLDNPADTFVPVMRKSDQGQETTAWVSTREEADHLLGSLSAEGRELYERQFGAAARELLVRAEKDGDPALLAECVRRFFWTDAGAEALRRLAQHHLDRGEAALAAHHFERLLRRLDAPRLTPETLWDAGRAFRLAGDPVNAERAWRLLTLQAGANGLRIGERTQTLKEWQAELEKMRPPTLELPKDWPLYRRDLARSGQGTGGAPFLEQTWTYPTMREEETRKMFLGPAVAAAETRHQVVLPAFSPILIDGKVIHRDYWGVHARDLKSGKILWESDSWWSLDRCVQDSYKKGVVKAWLDSYLQVGWPSVLWDNSTVGTLSTDALRVYGVDDLMLPPYAEVRDISEDRRPFPYSGPLTEENHLCAWDVKSGKLLWTLGGKPDEGDEGPDLSRTYFLGPPLPLDGRLYVLTAKDRGLRLLRLDPVQGKITGSLLLCTTRTSLLQDPLRRIQAAHLAYSDGILVCPTNAGALFAVDLLTYRVLWTHVYRAKGVRYTREQLDRLLGRVIGPPDREDRRGDNYWQVTAPVIHQGKVIFTAPDGSSLRCLNLSDGALLWQVKKAEDDLYLAGVAGDRVLVVGRLECRAHRLSDGKLLWRVSTGLPSGQGALAGDAYYLPLEVGLETKGPEVCVIDLDKGRVRGHCRAHAGTVPGNLLLAEGQAFSQTAAALTAFPQREEQRDQIEQRLKGEPKDAGALLKHAELLLDRGDLEGAVQDLHEVLKASPAAAVGVKARQKLYETLTDYLERDFRAAAKYLDEYRDLCRSAAELARYHLLVARGREGQGELVDALRNYLEFVAVADPTELVQDAEEPAVRAAADVWVRGRVAALLAKATPAQRKDLEKAIAALGTAARAGRDLGKLRAFVDVFGSTAEAGRAARLTLVEELRRRQDFLGAEQQLLLLSQQTADARQAAAAVEALARLCLDKGLMADALAYYRVLGTDFAGVVLSDGETGADLLRGLGDDKRFLPYLTEPDPLPARRIKATEARDPLTPGRFFTFTPAGPVPPYFHPRRLTLDLDNHRLQWFGPENKDPLWTVKVREPWFADLVGSPLDARDGAVRFPYRTAGHVVVLDLGGVVVGLDPIAQRLLWSRTWLRREQTPDILPISPDKDGAPVSTYQQGVSERVGETVRVVTSCVCVQLGSRLVALDALSGRVLWERDDLDPDAVVFGDERRVYAAEHARGEVTATRAFRLTDGRQDRQVPDFAAVFRRQERIFDGRLLTAETAQDRLVLRLYDIASGKDVWQQAFAARALLVHTEDPHRAGVIEPDGRLTVVDLRTQQVIFRTAVAPRDIENVLHVSLLEDSSQFYLLIDQADDPSIDVWPSVEPSSGIRALPVNGVVAAWSRATGKLIWRNGVKRQMLLQTAFADTPVLVFAGWYKISGPQAKDQGNTVEAVTVLDKRTGRLIYDRSDKTRSPRFYTPNADMKTGALELVRFDLKITLTVEK